MIKPFYIVGIIVIIALIVVIYLEVSSSNAKGSANTTSTNAGLGTSSNAQMVSSGDTVEVYYTGTLTNGTVFDTNVGKQPLQFTVGSGQVIAGFDQGVIGMQLNQTKTITLPPSEAYGEVNQSLIIIVPIKDFGNQSVTVGMTVTKTVVGNEYQGTVTSVNSTNATIDFNPPLAGKTLIFQIKVIGIQQG
jgi:peptidylprolyl isomerase